ncbi:MAG: peptide chain release factor N(5)-glutamine methyltransferase [Phyllobacterium sp.]
MAGPGRGLADVTRQARAVLDAAGIDTADLDARLLVEWVTGCDALETIRNPDRHVHDGERAQLDAALSRRISGESVHRILGRRAFYGIELALSAETLEPRPDTEALVELALPFLRERIGRQGVADIADLGTGTGAIALALLDQLPQLRAIGVDISHDALATARANAERLGLSARFSGLHSDWVANLSGSYDMIISNPPYIASSEIARLQREVALHDPRQALDGGSDGLGPYRIIAGQARSHLRPGGGVALEIGAGQRADIEAIFDKENFTLTAVQEDYGGHERALLFRPVEK